MNDLIFYVGSFLIIFHAGYVTGRTFGKRPRPRHVRLQRRYNPYIGI